MANNSEATSEKNLLYTIFRMVGSSILVISALGTLAIGFYNASEASEGVKNLNPRVMQLETKMESVQKNSDKLLDKTDDILKMMSAIQQQMVKQSTDMEWLKQNSNK